METARRIYRNTVYLGTAEIVSKLLQFAVMIVAARELTQGEFGAFNFALALAFIATILADMGVSVLLVRTIARDKALLEKYVTNALVLKAIFSVGTFLLVLVGLLALGYRGQTLEVALLMLLFAIIGTFTEFMYSIFRAFERMEFDSILKISRMLLLAFFSITVLMKGMGVVVFAFMFIVVECIVALIGFIIISKKFVGVRLRFSWLDSNYRDKLRSDALPFGLSAMFGNVYFYASILILSFFEGDIAVAKFSSAYNIALALLFIPTVYTSALYPVLSRFFVESKSKLVLLFEKSLKYLFIIGLPIGVSMMLLSSEIMGLFYGGRYGDASIALGILGGFIILKFINFLLGTVLSSADKQWERMKSQGIVAGINLIVCLVFVWKWGFMGAALATLLTEAILICLYVIQVSRVVRIRNIQDWTLKPLMCVMGSSICVVFLPFHYVVSAAIGGFVYVVMLFIVGALDREDRDMMREVFSSGRL